MSESGADRDTLVLERKPISVFLRERLAAAGRRAWANDHLSDFVGPIELDALENEVADRANEMLRALVIDTESDPNTRDTGRRVARMFVREVFAGRYQPRPEVTEFEGIRQADECFAIGPIAIRSCCAHHLVPITGQAWVGVIPNRETATVIGLSKYHRLTQWIMSRPQIQEEAVEQLADELEGAIEAPRALAVVIRAKHLCCGWRGVKDDASLMTTSVMRGAVQTRPEGQARVPGPDCWHGLLMIHRATKTYGHDLGLSVAFRQWRADSHCRYLHGYAIAVRLTFEASSLDARGWVIDFGSLKPVKAMLQTTFDHVLLVAEDDPQRDWFLEAQRRDIAQVFVVERTGCEAFASLIHGIVSDWLKGAGHYPRVRLVQVDVMEHGANAAHVVHDEDRAGR